jgi:crotonobetainyl-CoA:carnitine CoA-transferase CaiB-like acyl-CoA transferase
MFLQMNRNKRSLVLDPMHETGREVVKRLVRQADVVIANLPGETLKAMGLDYESVSAINPRAVVAVVSAFGLEGPYASRVGFDGVAQAMSGSTYFSGTEDQPVRCSAPYVDFGTASLLAMGVLAALRARDQTGRGQLVEGALLRTALTYFSPTLIEEDVLKIDRKPTLNRSQTAGPSDIFRTKDGWITVAVNGDPLFRRVCKLIGAPEWIEDARFASDKARGTLQRRSNCSLREGPRTRRAGLSSARNIGRSACAGGRILHAGRFSGHWKSAGCGDTGEIARHAGDRSQTATGSGRTFG